MANSYPEQLSDIPDDLKERYCDFQFVGAGGMGMVLSAVDTRLDKRVAIKLLKRSSESPSHVLRFQQEARAVSKLNHRNIVQVLDFGYTTCGMPFLVMEFVDGEDLGLILKSRGVLGLDETVEIAIHVLEGLTHAHANGVVHRDLKPGNIMLRPDGSVKILDFGLAKIMSLPDTDWRLTLPGQPVGSLLYMSPEQLRGEEADERADIYALALVMYQSLSGQVPLAAKTALEIVSQRLNAAPPALPHQDGADNQYERINKILKTALAIDPEIRFASAASMKEALQELQDLLLDDHRDHGDKTEARGKRLRSSQLLVIATGLALLLLSYQVLAPFLNSQSEEQQPPSRKRESVELKESFEVPPPGEVPPGFMLWVENGTRFTKAAFSLKDEDLQILQGSGIRRLDLSGNKEITRRSMSIVSSLPLDALLLRDTKLGDDCIGEINEIKTLVWLRLAGSRVTDNGVLALAPSNRLEILDLKYLPKVTDRGLEHVVKAFPNLQRLNICDTGVTAKGLEHLRRLPHLIDLYAGGLDLRDRDIDVLAGLGLRSIELTANPITDAAMPLLRKLPRLNWVSFEHCKDITPQGIARLRREFPGVRIKPVNSPVPTDEQIEIFQAGEP